MRGKEVVIGVLAKMIREKYFCLCVNVQSEKYFMKV